MTIKSPLFLLLLLFLAAFLSSIITYGAVPGAAPNVSAVNVNDTDADGNIELYWNASGDADRYLIYRSNINISNVSLNVTLVGNVTGRFFEDNATNHNQTYFYAIQPANDTDGANAAVFATNLNATANDSRAPQSPSEITVSTLDADSLRILWSRVILDNGSNVDTNVTYFIFRSTTTGINTSNFSRALANTTELNYTDTGLTASTSYFYAVTIRDDALNYNDGMSSFNSTLINNSWREFNITGFPPYGNVSGHAVVKDNVTNLLYFFGGYAGDVARYLRDLYAVNLTNRTIHANLTSTSPTEAPGVRGYGAMAFDPENSSIFHFGGYNGSYFQELWQYTITNSTWVNISYGNFTRFDPRAGWIYPQMIYRNRDNALYVVGGYNNAGNTVSVWYVFNITAGNWTLINVSAAAGGIVNNVTHRYAQNLIYVPHTAQRPEDYLFMFGGVEVETGTDPVTNHTFLYNFTSGNWTQLFMFGGQAPAPRDFASMAYGDAADIAVLSGGRNATTGRNDMNTTWVFNFSTMTWNLTTVANTSKTSFGGQMVDPPPINKELEGTFIMIGGEIFGEALDAVRDVSIFEWLDISIHGMMILLQDGTQGTTSASSTSGGGSSGSSGGGSSGSSSSSSAESNPSPSEESAASSAEELEEVEVPALPPAPPAAPPPAIPSIISLELYPDQELEELGLDEEELLERPPFITVSPADTFLFITYIDTLFPEPGQPEPYPQLDPFEPLPFPPSPLFPAMESSVFMPLAPPDEQGTFPFIIGGEEELPGAVRPTADSILVQTEDGQTFIMVLPIVTAEMVTYTFFTVAPNTELDLTGAGLSLPAAAEKPAEPVEEEPILLPAGTENIPLPLPPIPDFIPDTFLRDGEVEIKIETEEEIEQSAADPVSSEGIMVITQYGTGSLEFKNPETGEWIKMAEGAAVPGGAAVRSDPDSSTLIKVPGIGLVEILPLAEVALTKKGIEEALLQGVAVLRNAPVEGAKIGFLGEVSYTGPETGEKVVLHDYQEDKIIPAGVEVHAEDRSLVRVPGLGIYIAEEGKQFTLTPEGIEQALADGSITLSSDFRVPSEPLSGINAIKIESMDTEVSYQHPETGHSFTVVEQDGRTIPAGASFFTGRYGIVQLSIPWLGTVQFEPQQIIPLDAEHIDQALDEGKARIIVNTPADGFRVADTAAPVVYIDSDGVQHSAAEERVIPEDSTIITGQELTVVEIGGVGYVELAPNSRIETTVEGIEQAQEDNALAVIDLSTIGVHRADLGISYTDENDEYHFVKGGGTIPEGTVLRPRVGDEFYVPYFGILRVAKYQDLGTNLADNPKITFDYTGIKQALEAGYLKVKAEIQGTFSRVYVLEQSAGSTVRYKASGSEEWQELQPGDSIPLGSIVSNENAKRLQLVVQGIGIITIDEATELPLTEEGIESFRKTFDVFMWIDLRPKEKEQSRAPASEEGKKFSLSTEISVTAAKGTHFWNSYDAEQKVNIIGVYEGLIEVTNTLTGETMLVSPQDDGRPGVVIIRGEAEAKKFPVRQMVVAVAAIIGAGIIAAWWLFRTKRSEKAGIRKKSR